MNGVPWRRIVIEQLRLLESKQEQLEYETAVPRVDITRELLSGWFDDAYHPEAEDFAINFSRDELQALEVFNKAFRDQVQGLPSSEGTVRSWHVSPQWQEVMSSAKSALIVLLPSTSAKP